MTPSSLNSLTDAEKRVRIAEACGWRFIHFNEGSNYWSHIVRIANPDGKAVGSFYGDVPKFKSGKRLTEYHERKKQALDRAGLPDYLNDLNAMAEAEATLDARQQDLFARQLSIVMGLGYMHEHGIRIDTTTKILFATSRQRAEAFLDTIAP